jgi:hypothetical protein
MNPFIVYFSILLFPSALFENILSNTLKYILHVGWVAMFDNNTKQRNKSYET